MVIQHVLIAPETDGVDGLYIDGKLVLSGDAYHDSIGSRIEGFLAGMHYMGWNGVWEKLSLSYEHPYAIKIYQRGDPMPESFSNLPLANMKSRGFYGNVT